MLGSMKKTVRVIQETGRKAWGTHVFRLSGSAVLPYQSSPGVIDGRAIGNAVKADLRARIADLKAKDIVPGLVVILVGNRVDSGTYVRMKAKSCDEVGIASHVYKYDESTTQSEILETVRRLNADPQVHGILMQLPLPQHIDEALVLESVDPLKDVDGLHPDNMKKLLMTYNHHTGHNVDKSTQAQSSSIPCTPLGCIEILDRCNIPIEGKEALVIGRSNMVGIPVALLLIQRNATVTIAHSRTKNIEEVVRRADIVVAAVGKAELVKGDWIKPGAVVIDVGINDIPDATKKAGHRLVGDVDFEGARERASLITPVPGGVGPMTIAMLLRNTVNSAYAALARRNDVK